jgi:hypothetical protein
MKEYSADPILRYNYEMAHQLARFLLFCILVLFVTSTHGAAIDAGEDREGTISYDEFFIEGISIGSSYDEVVASLGEPVKVVKEIITGGQGLLVYYRGLDIVVSGDDVVNIRVTGTGHRMKNGITVGSSREEVFDKLGKVPATMHRGRKTLRYGVLTPRGGYSDAQLIIYLRDNKVDEIVFFFAYV